MNKRKIKASQVSLRTRNPIRQIVDNLKIQPNKDKKFISLALGDPTTHGNLKLAQPCVDEITNLLKSYKANGYGPSIGIESARDAIAQKSSLPNHSLSKKDVYIASGCSDALNLCIGALCNESQNILLPAPGFSLYETLASSKDPQKQWEIDLDLLESLIDDKTACILLNNPSNPCGSVYSENHLLDFLSIARKYDLPVIADEIYADMVFSGNNYIPLAKLTEDVPILSCGGLAKKYLVPGWRVGWICVYDKSDRLNQVREGIVNLSQLIIGANSLIQAAVPFILNSEDKYHLENMRQLEANALESVSMLQGIPGLKVVAPQGAMYLMLEINMNEFKSFSNDLEFVEKLAEEEAVLCLPGQCFRCEGAFVRIVFSSPIEILKDAYTRIRNFCERHHKG